MEILELAMTFNPWKTFTAGVTVGVFTGIFLAYWGNRWINHDTRLEVRTRDVDEHTLVTGEANE